MENLLPFFLVFFAGVVFSSLFGRLHLPWVTALIAGGILIGPHGLGMVEVDDTIRLMSEIGVVFLTFMAGLETKLSSITTHHRTIAFHALFHGGLPLIVGFLIGGILGFGLIEAIILGIIFMSSSVAVIIPSLEDKGILDTKLGRVIIASTIVVDIAALLGLSLILQSVSPLAKVPLPIFYIVLFVFLVGLRYVLPYFEKILSIGKVTRNDLFQQEIRAVIAVLFVTIIIFEALGLHPVVGGFFAGLVLSETIKSKITIEKLRAISYGVFIPVFFVAVGLELDFTALFRTEGALFLVLIIVGGAIAAKFFSGFAAGQLEGFTARESALIGAAAIPRLSTTLAIIYTGDSLGFIRPELATALIIMSFVTTFIGPFLMRYIRISHASIERYE